jgi:hypothetical protein
MNASVPDRNPALGSPARKIRGAALSALLARLGVGFLSFAILCVCKAQTATRDISLLTLVKMENTIFPVVEIRNISLEKVLAFVEINFRKMNPGDHTFAVRYQTPKIPPLVFPGKNPPLDPRDSRLSLSLTAIPVAELLRYVADLSNSKFRIQGQTVIFTPATAQNAFTPFYELEDWKLEAKRLYPDLRDEKSELYRLTAKEAEVRKVSDPRFFQDQTWPLRLAANVAKTAGIIPRPDEHSVNPIEHLPRVTTTTDPTLTGLEEKKATDIAKFALPSVFTVVVQNPNGQVLSQGSSFLVEGDVVATNYHVIDLKELSSAQGVAMQVRGSNLDAPVPVIEILGVDEQSDLALLRVARSLGNKLPLIGDDSLEVGQPVFAVGTPMGLENTFSAGVLSSTRNFMGRFQLQITAPISKGSSGGPVLNSKGEVIGIAVAVMKDGQNLNFAVAAKHLRDLLAKVTK